MPRQVPILLQVVTGDARPIGRQIVDGIRRQIASGELQAGDLLPSVRGLAKQLMINPNTVAKAYADLCSEGWLDARQGLGLFVAAPRQCLSEGEQLRRLDQACQRFVDEVMGLDFSAAQISERIALELAQYPSRYRA